MMWSHLPCRQMRCDDLSGSSWMPSAKYMPQKCHSMSFFLVLGCNTLNSDVYLRFFFLKHFLFGMVPYEFCSKHDLPNRLDTHLVRQKVQAYLRSGKWQQEEEFSRVCWFESRTDMGTCVCCQVMVMLMRWEIPRSRLAWSDLTGLRYFRATDPSSVSTSSWSGLQWILSLPQNTGCKVGWHSSPLWGQHATSRSHLGAV